MTLQDLFDYLSANPFFIFAYFLGIPLTALIAGWLGKGEGHISPWKYLYACLIYLICVPGIFAITLNVYLFLFESGSILQTNLITQILPIASMILTLWLIRRNVDLDNIPGFDKLSGLVMMISAVLIIMWIIDRTHILIFSSLKIQYLLGAFIALLIMIRFGWSRFFAKSN